MMDILKLIYPADVIQIGILIVLFFTLLAILRQMILQNRIFSAQILRDRFEMYWKTLDPVSEREIKELEVYPDDYIDRKVYDKSYKGKPDAIHKYIEMMKLYEYLAFSYALKQLRLPDPLGYHFTEMWAAELIAQKEFVDAHEYHKAYYPEFAKFVDQLINKKNEPGCTSSTKHTG
jgi:hypothetical protein